MSWLKRDGVALYYLDEGAGSPPLVLVHGWCCDQAFMAPQIRHFRETHRVVAVDLRGHGESDKPLQSYSIPAFADDLLWMCRELAIEQPVLVGHSMGGAVALECAAKEPESLAGIILLDTAVPPAADAWTDVKPVIAGLQTSNYREVLRRFVSATFFLPMDDSGDKSWAIDAMLKTPQHVMASAFEGIFSWDSELAIEKCKVPTMYIASTRPRGDVDRYLKANPQLVHGQVIGSGHFVQLEVPDQVNAMISRFVSVYLE